MINLYEESIQGLDTILYDKDMLKECVFVYREQQGQYFCATYYHSLKDFKDFSTSGKKFKLKNIIRFFKDHYWQSEIIKKVITLNKKRKFFRGSDKIRLFFTFNGKFLSLVDVWSEKESYIKPEDFNEFFCFPVYINSSTLIFKGVLNNKFIKSNPGAIIRRQNGERIRI